MLCVHLCMFCLVKPVSVMLHSLGKMWLREGRKLVLFKLRPSGPQAKTFHQLCEYQLIFLKFCTTTPSHDWPKNRHPMSCPLLLFQLTTSPPATLAVVYPSSQSAGTQHFNPALIALSQSTASTLLAQHPSHYTLSVLLFLWLRPWENDTHFIFHFIFCFVLNLVQLEGVAFIVRGAWVFCMCRSPCLQ